jgi:hypothetical protein
VLENTRDEVFQVERNITADVQNGDELTLEANSAIGSIELSPVDQLRGSLRKLGFEHLPELARRQSDGRYESKVLRRLQAPIGLAQVEMLEAELKNQGILPRRLTQSFSLVQIVSQETSMWCWRADRYGSSGAELQFEINLPEYLVARAQELAMSLERDDTELDPSDALLKSSGMWRRKVESPASVHEELQYLERFAAYLNGAFDHAANGYQRGLNLVLAVLSCSQLRMAEQREEDARSIFCLPLKKEEFFQTLKAAKSGLVSVSK